MPDKKLTDNEIKKALKCCYTTGTRCEDCPLCDIEECNDTLMAEYVKDLINRLQAENERLQNILICFMDALGKVRKVDDIDEISLIPLMSELNKQYRAQLKAEAYKEFAEQLDAEIESSDKYIREYDDSEVQKAYNKGLRDALKVLKELAGDKQKIV